MASAILEKQNGSVPTFQIADKRPETIMQRKLQEIADNSSQGNHEARLHSMSGIPATQHQQIQPETEVGAANDISTQGQSKSKTSLLEVPSPSGTPPIQRDIGFEFEVEVPLYNTKDDPNEFFPAPHRKDTTYSKAHKIHDQPEFHIVQDHSATGTDGIRTIPEFVIHPTSEDNYVDDFLANVYAAFNYVNASKSISEIDKDTYIGTPTTPFNVSKVGGGQATYGVRPEGIEEIFKVKAKQFGVAPSPLRESEILVRSVYATDAIMKNELFEAVKSTPEGSKIRGYIMLICQYCISNSISELQNGGALDKNKVPFLIRSSLGAIARATLSETSLVFLSDTSAQLRDLIIQETKAIRGTPIISPTKSEKNPIYNKSVEGWLLDVLCARDETLKWGSELNAEDSRIIPPEETGSAVNAEDKKRTMGAVLEERNMEMGSIMISNWVSNATKIWEKVCKANLKTK